MGTGVVGRWMNSIAFRIAIAIAVSLVATVVLAIFIITRGPTVQPYAYSPKWVVEEITTAFFRFNAARPQDRRSLAEDLTDEWLTYEWLIETNSAEIGTTPWHLSPLSDGLSSKLFTTRFSVVSVLPFGGPIALLSDTGPKVAGPDSGFFDDRPLPGFFNVRIELNDGSVMGVTATPALPARWAGLKLAVLPGVFLFVIMATAWFVSRFLAVPINRFSDAAYRLGIDPEPKPLPKSGPSELQVAVDAFNLMQHRIKRFVDDRTMVLAAISHDLRTPLTRQRLRVEQVQDGQLRDRMVADLDQMEAMLSSVLAFAKGQSDPEPRQKLDIAALLMTLTDEVNEATPALDEAEGSDVSIEPQRVRYTGPDRCPFEGRTGSLQRLFENLIDNAVKYGGDHATVSLANDVDQIAIVVSDTGPGIPNDDLENVFEPFFRVDKARGAETGGTGLGLTIARSIARQHGGDIMLKSGSDGGLEVTVTLPAQM